MPACRELAHRVITICYSYLLLTQPCASLLKALWASLVPIKCLIQDVEITFLPLPYSWGPKLDITVLTSIMSRRAGGLRSSYPLEPHHSWTFLLSCFITSPPKERLKGPLIASSKIPSVSDKETDLRERKSTEPLADRPTASRTRQGPVDQLFLDNGDMTRRLQFLIPKHSLQALRGKQPEASLKALSTWP